MNKLVQRGLLNALGTAVYVAAVATIMQNGERIFGGVNKFVQPVVFLMLFVISAAVTGGLVVGKPLLMYLGNEKSDAVMLFLYTLGGLVAILALLVLVGSRV